MSLHLQPVPLRTVPLFDPAAVPQSWSDRMQPGEFAVLLADAQTAAPLTPAGDAVLDVNATPCLIFPSLAEAVAWSEAKLRELPTVRSRIYDHYGLGKQPARIIVDPQYVQRDSFDHKTIFRIGLGFLIAGGGLCLAEWVSNFHLYWGGVIGARLLIPGVLLVTFEIGMRLTHWGNQRREQQAQQ